MTKLNVRFGEAQASEILKLAARYHNVETQAYSEAELVSAGLAVEIPDRLIRKAIQELETQRKKQLEQHVRAQYYRKKVVQLGLFLTTAIAFWCSFTYNHLKTAQIEVETTFRQVQNQQQRRADLIPQLIEITNIYTSQEKDVISQLIRARQVYLQADKSTKAIAKLDRAIVNFSDYAATNQEFNSSQLYVNLHYEITGTENRLAVAKVRYDHAVQNYARAINQFPQSLVAKVFKFN